MTEKKPYQDKEYMYSEYVENDKSGYDIADELCISTDTVYRWLNRHRIDRTDPRGSKGGNRKNRAWFGTVDDHPGPAYEVSHCSITNKRVRIHRLVAVSKYGISAVKNKDVHHKNGLSWDNRPDNLEVLSHSEHMSVHSTERVQSND